MENEDIRRLPTVGQLKSHDAFLFFDQAYVLVNHNTNDQRFSNVVLLKDYLTLDREHIRRNLVKLDRTNIIVTINIDSFLDKNEL